MPKITDLTIQIKNKKRCNLFLDGEFFRAVSLETVLKQRLKVGMEIDQKSLSQTIFEDDKTEALSKAADYISKNLKTQKQVKEYLLKKGYSEEIVWHCIDKLKEYGYINDEEYSKRYIESVSKNQGRRLVEYKLMMKGVKKEDIGLAYSQTELNANENAKTVAEKYLRNKDTSKENLAKTYRYLISRGFSYEEANFALSSFKENE